MQSRYFSDSYAQARERFLAAAKWPRAWPRIRSRRAAPDEALSTDVALIGDAKAERLLIMTSATHGAEGFCGSGCQLACWTMRRCWRARAIPAWHCCWCTRSILMAFRGSRAPTRATST